MQFVAIDTTSKAATVALFEDGACIATAESDAFQGQAEALLPLIEDTLARRGWDKRRIRTWCACSGPGSFTGIRVALATVRGICLATGAEGVAVTAFQAIRATVASIDETVAVVVPGLPGEYFCEIARGGEVLAPAVLLNEDTLAEALRAYPNARRVDAAGTTAKDVGQAYVRFGGDASLSPLYIAPPRITIPKPKTYAAAK